MFADDTSLYCVVEDQTSAAVKPVIMRAASSCTLSSNSDSCKLQLSQTIPPYSSIGRINPIYNFSNDYLIIWDLT
jgi:hypothetical protein